MFNCIGLFMRQLGGVPFKKLFCDVALCLINHDSVEVERRVVLVLLRHSSRDVERRPVLCSLNFDAHRRQLG